MELPHRCWWEGSYSVRTVTMLGGGAEKSIFNLTTEFFL